MPGSAAAVDDLRTARAVIAEDRTGRRATELASFAEAADVYAIALGMPDCNDAQRIVVLGSRGEAVLHDGDAEPRCHSAAGRNARP